jgi:radical SAM protein with 4Fe4S-binding SPASM domain
MNCPTIPEIDLGEWGQAMLSRLNGRRHPLGGMFELTDRCNLACVHCYINQPAGNRAVQAAELTTSQVVGLLDQVADAGCLFLLFSGGEILLRPDFPEIYRHALQRGIIVSLFTNGTLLTARIADMLADWRPRSIEITLYGATAQTYEKVTQVPGSYAHCLRGIKLLQERSLPLSLKTILMTANRHELPGMVALAGQLGTPFHYDGILWPRLDGSQNPFEYQLSLSELIDLDRQDPERQREWSKLVQAISGNKKVRNEYIYSCGAGMRSFHIDSAGRMSICTMSRGTTYDLQQMRFQAAWEQLGELRKIKRQMNTACQSCTIGGLCLQCPGWSQAVHGDNETPVEFVCALGHLRTETAQHAQM